MQALVRTLSATGRSARRSNRMPTALQWPSRIGLAILADKGARCGRRHPTELERLTSRERRNHAEVRPVVDAPRATATCVALDALYCAAFAGTRDGAGCFTSRRIGASTPAAGRVRPPDAHGVRDAGPPP